MRGVPDNNFIELYICWAITVFGFIGCNCMLCTEGQDDEIILVLDEW